MKCNPVINAAAAVAYIGAVVQCMQFIESFRHNTPDTLIDVISVMSLFVLSAAVMAFLFFYQPIVLLIDGKKAKALSYFLKTLGVFGAITLALLALVSLQ